MKSFKMPNFKRLFSAFRQRNITLSPIYSFQKSRKTQRNGEKPLLPDLTSIDNAALQL